MLVGADGARRSTPLFWDTQLERYCSVPDPTASATDARRPRECRTSTVSAFTIGLSDFDYAFSDSTCRTPVGLGPLATAVIFGSSQPTDALSDALADAGLPVLEPLTVAELGDGGWLSAAPYTGRVFRRYIGDGGCESITNVPGAFFSLGGLTTRPPFAKMSIVRE